MLRNYSCDKISDRFISGRTKEREIILDKFKADEDSIKKYGEDIYKTPRCKSQTKSRKLNLIESDEIFSQKIYLNLLKTQIFQSSQSCSTGSDKSVRINKNNLIENIRKNLNKSFFNSVKLVCDYDINIGNCPDVIFTLKGFELRAKNFDIFRVVLIDGKKKYLSKIIIFTKSYCIIFIAENHIIIFQNRFS